MPVVEYTPESGHAGSLVKFNRAIRQIKTLDRLSSRFVKKPACSIDYDYDESTREIFGVLSVIEEPPPMFSAIIGEILYDLRSTLDHFVYALTVKELKHPLPGTEFPIFRDDKAYFSQARSGGLHKIRGVSDAARAVIEEFQPWTERQRGRRPESHHLWALHELNNIDKHRRVHLCSTTLERMFIFPDEALIGPGGMKFTQPQKLKGSTEVVRWAGPPSRPDRIHVETEMGLGLAFDESEIVAVDGRQVGHTLLDLAETVQRIGIRLEPLLI